MKGCGCCVEEDRADLSSTDTAHRDERGGASWACSISLCVSDSGQSGPQGEPMTQKCFGMFSEWQEQTEGISFVSVGGHI